MADFIVSRNRDASSAILGFCYQVDCTIARWLALETNQALELERGEDIDIVAKSLLGGADQGNRQFEQVKHLSRRVSLRSKETLAFLANAVEHRLTNPGHSLISRFVTNAEIASERPAAFDDRASAISVWESLRKSTLDGSDRALRLAGLRALLKSAKRPYDSPEATWTAFQKFVETSDEPGLSEFVNTVEWSTANPNAAGMQSRVRERLQAHGFSSDPQHAEELHGRLFLYVMRLLSQSGQKCLTQADLIRLAAASPLSDAERQFLRAVSAHVTVLNARVDTLEVLIREQHASILAPLVAQVQRLAAAENIPADLAASQTPIDTTRPSRLQQLCERRVVVDSLSPHSHEGRCLWLHGSIGSGKTQLGLLLLERLGLEAVWLALRDLNVPLALSTIQHGLRQAAGSTVGEAVPAIVAAIKERGGTAIVLDDVPPVISGSPLANLVVELASAGWQCGVPVIVVTHHALPSTVKESARDQIVDSPIAPFSVDEARDLFAKRGANASFCGNAAIATLNEIAGGHPWMLVAMAKFFEARGWQIDSQSLEEVSRFAHTESMMDDVVRRVVTTVEDGDSRNLLYRLGLAVGAFQTRTVQAVALVDPALDRPRERLSEMSGLWIEQRSNATMAVSPLIRPLAESELLPKIRQLVLLALGEGVLTQPQHSVTDLWYALTYFSSAGAFNRAALLLIVALKSSPRRPRDTAKQLLALSKVPRPIASHISKELRIYLEGERIRLAARLGRPIEKALRRLLARCRQVGRRRAWSVFSSALTLAPVAAQVDFPLGLEFFQLARATYRDVRAPVSRKRMRISRFRPEYLLWQVVPYISNASDLSAWLETLAAMSKAQLSRTLDWPDAEEGVRIAVARVWMKEFERPEGERDWQRVLKFYEELIARTSEIGIESIWAEAVASKIVVLARLHEELTRGGPNR